MSKLNVFKVNMGNWYLKIAIEKDSEVTGTFENQEKEIDNTVTLTL